MPAPETTSATGTQQFQNPEFNNTLYWSWPAQRPVAVYRAEDVKDDGRTLGEPWFSVRGPGTKTELSAGVEASPYGPANPAEVGRYQQQKPDEGPGISRILDNWMKIGTVIQATNIDGEFDPNFYLEVESRLDDEPSDSVQPWPNTVRPRKETDS